MIIRKFEAEDTQSVIKLWLKCNLVRPWNDPAQDIARKMKVNPELFLVGVSEERIIATAMGGYEGHRGWVNYLAVDPECQKAGLGRLIMQELEKLLLGMGCPKINLQVRSENHTALQFYSRIGYKNDNVVSLGKRLIEDSYAN